MKKIICLILSLFLMIQLTGCGISDYTEQEVMQTEEVVEVTINAESAPEKVVEEGTDSESLPEETTDADSAPEEVAKETTDTESAPEEVVEEVAVEEVSQENREAMDTSAAFNGDMEIDLNDGSYTITEAGTYNVSGSLADGQIVVDASDEADVQIILNDVYLNCNFSAPIFIKNADGVTITLEGDNNVLSIGADISGNADSIDGVIFSKSDLTFNGMGTLVINSDYTHGIVGKDDIEFVGGNYGITATNDGVQANDSVSVIDSNISIIAGKDGIQVKNDENIDKGYIYLADSEVTLVTGEDAITATNYVEILSGTYEISSLQDGISADLYVEIVGGYFDIATGGGYQGVLNIITVGEGSGNTVSETDKLSDSMKAIKGNDISIWGGTFVISSYEDALNANNNIVINGGDITINSGDEALTAHNTLEINDGTILIENGYEGLEGGYVTINGGDISITVLDDGINGGESYSLVTIAGGSLKVTCQGDGLDSNGDMLISGGYIVLDVTAIYAGGDGNIDVTGTLTFTGGTIVDGSGVTIDPMATMGGRMPGGGRRK